MTIRTKITLEYKGVCPTLQTMVVKEALTRIR